ncbi:MAG: TIGR01777 family oxidoreductase [Bacillota bacterium]|nr:TIGR01777 family oxidoreductase [Bacillota bacterium]
MKIAIAGGSGFVGSALTKELLKQNHEIFILTRRQKTDTTNGQVHFVEWLRKDGKPWEQLHEIDFFINLAGESINSGRWTSERKKRILDSRLQATEEIITILGKLNAKPRALINASAIGFYGTSLEETFTEEYEVSGNDFLAETVHSWEKKASEAEALGIRTVLCRFGIILDTSEGALPRMALPYKFFAGGKVGSGSQWMSWIHIDDVVRGILFAMINEGLDGPVNFTAPEPVTMDQFGRELGTVMNRPHWLPVPGFALKLLLGEMSTLVVEGQRVLPKKLIAKGFDFRFPTLHSALTNLF